MIAKINNLKRTTELQDVKSLCETTIAAMSSAIYNAVTNEARFEIERVAIENLFEGLGKYPDNKLISEWLNNEKRVYAIKNIGVRKAINSLKENEAKNDDALAEILEHFEGRVDTQPEVLVYEEFISALAGEYNWVPGVTTQLDALAKRVKNYKNDIDITKIIETMKLTRSNYLLPYIESYVNNYLANKTEQTKSFLKEALVKFSYDPFVRDIINLVMVDAKDLQLEYANAESAIDKVYSPLMYLGENEVLFNIKGNFYIKKGNNVNRLKKEQVDKIDENFKSLCTAINLPTVEITKKNITVYEGNNKAVITENTVEVNTHIMNEQQFKDAAEISQWSGDTNFYMLTEALRANFDEIVEVDFAKRVYLKEDESHAADIIKLRNNIYITTYDPTNNKSTFYRNINPIQAEKVMSEHMNFDVSNTFADILPNKEKIETSIEETKKEYTTYINVLTEKINTFKSEESTEVTKEVLSALEEELKEVKNEFKDYANEIEKYVSVTEGTTVTIDVDGQKYTVPIPEPTSTAKGEAPDNTAGMVIGAEHMEDSPSTEITFDDDQTELLGDSPSIQDDQVDLGVDNVEAQADAAEAGEEEPDMEDSEGEESEGAEEGEEDLGLGDEEEGGEDLGLGDEEEGGEGEDEEPEEELEAKDEDYDQGKDISEEGDNDEEAEEIEGDELEALPVEEAPEELEKGDLEGGSEEDEVEVEDGEVETKPANAPRVFLKKKVQEYAGKKKPETLIIETKGRVGLNVLNPNKKLTINEDAQILDQVIVDGQKGNVVGKMSNGDLLVQVQYSSKQYAPNKVKAVGEKQVIVTKPPYDFDPKTLQNLTTKALFEQFVKCGIYMGNTPVKLNDSYVKFSDWNNAEGDKPINVIVEGRSTFLPKNQIRILEDINTFADPTPYAWGIYSNEEGQPEKVLINTNDFMQAIGDAGDVTIIRNLGPDAQVTSVSRERIQPDSTEEPETDMSQFQ